MKQRINILIPMYTEQIPKKKEEGILYISKEYGVAIHLCACGCGGQSVTPLENNGTGWVLKDNNGLVTLRPSIGNWSGENPYHAHYHITNNKIDWLK